MMPKTFLEKKSAHSIHIGVFDSGIGGLTVLKSLAQNFPFAKFTYLGDTARLPYGSKSPETIRKYSEQIMNFLKAQNVDAIVIACNSASSQVSEKKWGEIPVFNVIDPGVRQALQTSVNLRIGVLGTRATINSQSYQNRLQQSQNNCTVIAQACPLFVPLAEEGWIDDPLTNLVVHRYLAPLLLQQIDTLVLGCTHYPLLKNSIEKVCGKNVHLVDSGQAIAEDLRNTLSLNQKITVDDKPEIHLLLTDLSEHLKNWASEIMFPLSVDEIIAADL